MTTVLGLDISTRTGWVLLEDEAILSGEWHFPKETGFSRLDHFAVVVNSLVAQYRPHLTVIEGYGFANAHTLATLVEIGTTIRQVLWDENCEWLEVAPNSLKKFVTGSGNAKKDQMMLEVFKRWQFETKSNNVADAYGLARVGRAYLGLDPLTKFQQEVVSKLKVVE